MPAGTVPTLLLCTLVACWCHTVWTRSTWKLGQNAQTFNAVTAGLTYADPDHKETAFFRILSVADGHSVLVGTRNAVLNISLSTMSLHKVLEWAPTADDVDLCTMKGLSENHCHNFIRLLFKQPNNRLIVCGTNAYRPLCRQYRLSTQTGAYQIIKDFDGVAVVPFDPNQNTTAVYLDDADELYTATVADFSATQPLVHRKPLSGPSAVLRTTRDDVKCLNNPQFVSSFADEDSVYFWFRETATELTNCAMYGGAPDGGTVFSRVARVCKNDQGDRELDSDTWTSFLKARLNCSMPGDIPFYFNEIQFTTQVVVSNRNGQLVSLVYAVFSSPDSLLRASAVCAFDVQAVKDIFERGLFRVHQYSKYAWLAKEVPSRLTPRPGSCSANSKSLPEDVVSFVRRNNLMADAVPNYFTQPLVVDTTAGRQLTSIAVQPGVVALDGHAYDLIFVGTSDGSVVKYVNVARGVDKASVDTVLIETMMLFADHSPVRNLKIVKTPTGQVSLLATSDSQLKLLPVHNCVNRTTCLSCVLLRDPFCAWDRTRHRCTAVLDGSWSNGDYSQNVARGYVSECLAALTAVDDMSNEINQAYALVDGPLIYSAECMIIAVLVTFILTATVTFFVGYRFAHWKTGLDAVPGFDSPLRKNLKNRPDNFDAYMPHLPVSKVTTNGNCMTIPHTETKGEKNVLTLNNGTLPRDYKAKKVYV